jgi:beta-glucosidase
LGSFQFSSPLLLGVTGSAAQLDGGACGSTWNSWFQRGRLRGCGNPAVAAGHWERWREDILLMHSCGIQTYRLSAPWSRIEPQENVFDREAIDHLREELLLLRGLGILPLLTLHHFSEPNWFMEKGGWEKEENVRFFLLYVERVVRDLGHLVGEFITINEPNVYALRGYYSGVWPPGKKHGTPAAALRVLSVMTGAHIRCYRLIHDVRRQLGFGDTKVGFSLRVDAGRPGWSIPPLPSGLPMLEDAIFQQRPLMALATGRFQLPLWNGLRVRHGLYCDFLGLSYYGARRRPGGLARGVYRDDMGAEIWPQGLVESCKKMLSAAELPIYITENGVCDRFDAFRARYIAEHLEAVSASGLPVQRYYYRGFLDGFEWTDGAACYGLAQTEISGSRSLRPSGRFYAELIRNGGVTKEMVETWIEKQHYHR